MPKEFTETRGARRAPLAKSLDETTAHKGGYSLTDAARYSGLSRSTVIRCLVGNTYRTPRGTPRYSKPRFVGDYVQVRDGNPSVSMVSFRDLIELRIIATFLKYDVKLAEIRLVGERLAERFNVTHPFCTRHFRVFDGAIVEEIEDLDGVPRFKEIARDQVLMDKIARPFVEEVVFDGDRPVRWEPAMTDGHVIVDPSCSFGRPIVTRGGVTTESLYKTFKAWGRSAARVARWYSIPDASVEAAVAFEECYQSTAKRAA